MKNEKHRPILNNVTILEKITKKMDVIFTGQWSEIPKVTQETLDSKYIILYYYTQSSPLINHGDNMGHCDSVDLVVVVAANIEAKELSVV